MIEDLIVQEMDVNNIEKSNYQKYKAKHFKISKKDLKRNKINIELGQDDKKSNNYYNKLQK